MRQRPLCIAFLSLMAFIIIARSSGFYLWGEPDKALRVLVSQLEGEKCVISGTVASREEKENSISYFIEDSYLIQNIPFQRANAASIEEHKKIPFSNIRLYTSKENPRFTIGSKIIIYGKPELYENAKNPGGFEAADYYAADNCCTYLYAEQCRIIDEPGFSFGEVLTLIREKIRNNLNSIMGEASSSALCAMLLGDRSEITDETQLNYSVSGLLHLLAVSGMHVAIIGGGVKKLLLFIKMKQRTSSIIAATAACLYCVFTGAGDSSIRAAVMFSVMQMGMVFLRSYDSISALSFAGIIMLLVRPLALFRSGFQLSFAAAAAISCVSPVLKKKIICTGTGRIAQIKKSLIDSAVVWLSVNLMTFPIVLYHFCEFPIYSIFTNILFVPLMGIIMPFGFAGAVLSLICMPLAKVLLFLPGIITGCIDAAGSFVSRLPFSVIILGKPAIWQAAVSLFGAVLLIYILKSENKATSLRKGFMVISGVLILMPVFRMPEGFSITALDVGQGDCAVINNFGNVFIMDGGSSSESEVGRRVILPYLKSQGIRQVEAVLISHNDDDHMGGIVELLEMIYKRETVVKIRHVVMPCWMKNDDVGKQIEEKALIAGTEVLYFKTDDCLKDGELIMRALSPDYVEEVEDGNENSLVLSVEYEKFRALYTGDIGFEREEELAGKFGKYDYLKAAHHGSKYSSGEAFLKEVSPSLCIISAPKSSSYGHPAPETIMRIEDAEVDWLQTGLCGAIRTEVKNGSMNVSYYYRER